jgi:hypothetical protein
LQRQVAAIPPPEREQAAGDHDHQRRRQQDGGANESALQPVWQAGPQAGAADDVNQVRLFSQADRVGRDRIQREQRDDNLPRPRHARNRGDGERREPHAHRDGNHRQRPGLDAEHHDAAIGDRRQPQAAKGEEQEPDDATPGRRGRPLSREQKDLDSDHDECECRYPPPLVGAGAKRFVGGVQREQRRDDRSCQTPAIQTHGDSGLPAECYAEKRGNCAGRKRACPFSRRMRKSGRPFARIAEKGQGLFVGLRKRGRPFSVRQDRVSAECHRSRHPLTGPGLSRPSIVMTPSRLNTAPFFITNCTLRTASMSSSGLPGTAMKSA